MVCFHSRYDLGDEHDFYDADEVMEFIKENKTLQLPLYLYDHSGISMSTTRNYPFNDVWDSGQVGIIYITYDKIKKEYGWKRITKKCQEQILNYLSEEVNVYDDYLRGNVYGYQVECKFRHEIIDSCWGFYGNNWKENSLLDQVSNPVCNCEMFAQLSIPELVEVQ